jgi:hypothetical protein
MFYKKQIDGDNFFKLKNKIIRIKKETNETRKRRFW